MDDVQTSLPIRISPQVWGADRVQIQSWLVVPGEEVWEGEVLAELGLPGIMGEVRSPTHGHIRQIDHQEGTWITADVVLGWIEPLPEIPERGTSVP